MYHFLTRRFLRSVPMAGSFDIEVNGYFGAHFCS